MIKPKEDDMMVGEAVSGGMKKKKSMKIFPHMRMEHQFFPEAKKMEVGKEYEVTLKLKCTGLSISKFQNDSEFDIVGVEFGKESNSKSEKDEEDEEE